MERKRERESSLLDCLLPSEAPFTCGEIEHGPRRISVIEVTAATQSPLPTSDAPPEPLERLLVALALAVERVVVVILAMAVATDIRLAHR
jgi:hypothetical protein